MRRFFFAGAVTVLAVLGVFALAYGVTAWGDFAFGLSDDRRVGLLAYLSPMAIALWAAVFSGQFK